MAHHGHRHPVLSHCLCTMCSKQIFNKAQLWPALCPTCPHSPLVPYCLGFCHWPATIKHLNSHTQHNRLIFQSKWAHFLDLSKLPFPPPAETADLLVDHVLHRIPSDIVSDRRPQFNSQVWKAFCSASEPQSVCLLVIIPSLMAKPSEPIRRWRLHSAVSPLLIHPIGSLNCPGWEMPL